MSRAKKKFFAISLDFWLLLIVALIINPIDLTIMVLSAAVMHELGHLAVLHCYHIKVTQIRMTALGAEIRTEGLERLSYGRELMVTLAGVFVNMLAAFGCAALGRRFSCEALYLYAGVHAVLGIFNLLPVLPLDGGRAIYLIVAFFFGPMVGDAAAVVVSLSVALVILPFGLYVSLVLESGYFFLIAAIGLLLGILPQLGLAKGAVKV